MRQRLCRSRWIDPTQYDWSADHWTAGVFPHVAPPVMPLPWPADRSHRLALRWQGLLSAALGSPHLTFRPRDHVVGAPMARPAPPAVPLGVQVRFASGGPPEDFGMMLWCVGFGEERRFARRLPPPPLPPADPNYAGFAFWETDPFERPDWGVASPPADLCALVSGGGDGALQDVIRLATLQKAAIDVYREIARTGWGMPGDVRHALFTAEDQAQRALLWCRPRSADEHRALRELHQAYVAAVDYLVSTDPHLNHLLVLLLAKVAAVAKYPAGPTIRAGCGVSGVSGHACTGSPWACHGIDHEVHLEQRPSCFGPAGGPAGKHAAQVVVIRHGIAPHPAFAGTPMAFARQVMPYHLP